MKKIIFLLVLVVIFYNCEYKYNDNTIRFRVISNSNNIKDIKIKEMVFNKISNNLKYYQTGYDIDKYIKNNINDISKDINEIFKEENYNKIYTVKYGYNYFPEKTIGNIVFKSGKYKSLVVEIGASKGSNYWCFLYPSLCFTNLDNEKPEIKLKIIEKLKSIFPDM